MIALRLQSVGHFWSTASTRLLRILKKWRVQAVIVFAEIMDFVLVVVVLAVGLTQLVIPLWNGTPFSRCSGEAGRGCRSSASRRRQSRKPGWNERSSV